MSLALLPSAPMATATILLPPAPPSLKRPRLSLNTTIAPSVLGKASTSLRLETLSATSPTARNTFRNAYHPAQRERTTPAQRPKLGALTTNIAPAISRIPTPLRTELPSSIDSSETWSSAASTSSASTVDSSSAEVPYKLYSIYNVTSVLKNGPLPRNIHCRTTMTQSKPMFPSKKNVAFRTPLTEEVETTKFTWKHSDIESSVSTISTLELSSPEAEQAPEKAKEDSRDMAGGQEGEQEPLAPQTGDKRESSDEEDSDTCPATPVAGRRKRHRVWQWTLGSVDQPTEEDEAKRTDAPAESTKNA